MILVELEEYLDPITLAVIDPVRQWSDVGYTTSATDSPAYQYWDARLRKRPSWARGGAAEWMDESELGSVGVVELENGDSMLLGLLNVPMRGRKLSVWALEEGKPLTSRVLLHTLWVDRIECPDELTFAINCVGISSKLDRQVNTGVYSGTSTAWDGRPMPLAIGHCLNVPAQLFDPGKLHYRVSQAAVYAITAVYENGDLLTAGTHWQAISEGFQMLYSPVGIITADVQGVLGGALGYISTLSEIATYLLIDVCGLTISQSGITSLNAIEADVGTNSLAIWISDSSSVRAVLTALLRSVGGFWCENSQGNLRYVRLKRPSVLATGITISRENQTQKQMRIRHDRAPNFSARVLAQRNWHQHSANEIAGVVVGTAFGVALTKKYRLSKSPVTFTIGDGLANAAKLPTKQGGIGLETLIVSDAQAQNEADHRSGLYPGALPLLLDVEILISSIAALPAIGTRVELIIDQLTPSIGRAAQLLAVSSGETEDAVMFKLRMEAQ